MSDPGKPLTAREYADEAVRYARKAVAWSWVAFAFAGLALVAAVVRVVMG